MLVKEEYDFISMYELLFAKRVKRYNEDGEEIKPFISPREIEARYEALKDFRSLNHKKMKAKCDMKRNIIKRVNVMEEPCFCTFTIKEETMQLKCIQKKLAKILRQVGIDNYCLITDYGEERGRMHFHGFVDTKTLKEEEIIKQSTKRYSMGFKIASIEKCIGWNLCVPLVKNQDLPKVVGYCLKYSIKEMKNNEFQHSMFASRNYQDKVCELLF